MSGWFSGMAGASALSGVTAGYLFGFVLAAGFIGLMVERRREWSLSQIISVMCIGVAMIYALGAAWLALLLHLDLATTMAIGVLPFIAADAVKVLFASSVACILTSGRA